MNLCVLSKNELSVQFYGRLSVLRKGVLKVLARVLGGNAIHVEPYRQRVWKNRFISTCDNEALDGFEEYGFLISRHRKRKGMLLYLRCFFC